MSRLVNRGRDDVRRRLAGELDDVLAEISFQRFNTYGFKRSVQMNLFGRHALTLDDQSRRAFARESFDDLVCFGRVAGPMNPGARSFSIRRELFQILVEIK